MPVKYAAWFYREKARETAALSAPMPPRTRYKGEEGLEQSQAFERYRLHLRQQHAAIGAQTDRD